MASGILSASVLSVVIVQAVIYHRQWGVMERTLIFSERAFVYAKEAIIVGGRNMPDRPRPTYPAFIAVTIENTGNTPARNLTVDVNACAIPAELPPDFSYPSFAKTLGSPTLIGPRAGSQITLPIEDVILGDVYARRRNLFVYGTVLYVDIFGRARQTQFCFRYNGFSLGKDGNIDKTIFDPGEGHNCDDENCPEKWGDNDAGPSGPK